MKLHAFTKSTFCNDLSDHINELFELAEEEDTTLVDSHFLGRLFRMASNKDDVSKIIKSIQQYVDKEKTVSTHVQALYDLVKFDFKHNLEFLIESVDNDPVKKDEFVQLLMSHWQSVGGYNGYLMNNDEPELDTQPPESNKDIKLIPSIKSLYFRLNQIIERDDPSNKTIQIIVRQDEHYTPIDINKETRSCFMIDAAADSKEY